MTAASRQNIMHCFWFVAAGILPAVAGGILAAWFWPGVRRLVSGVRLEAGRHGRLEARRYAEVRYGY